MGLFIQKYNCKLQEWLQEKDWECCKKLFSVGSIERRDGYSVLFLCLSSGSWTDGTESCVSEKDAVEFE
ncbi:unnamed protein product, partial [Brassica napus]